MSMKVYANGDVIGVNVNGSGNIIGKGMNTSLVLAETTKIKINPDILSKLDQKYADAFKLVSSNLNNEIKRSRNIRSVQVFEVQESLESLAKETEGLKSEEHHSEKKKRNWEQKFLSFAKHAIKIIPKTAAGLCLLSPLTSTFAGVVEGGLQGILEALAAKDGDSNE